MPWYPGGEAFDLNKMPSGLLPPPGGDSIAIASFVDMLLLESTQDEQRLRWQSEAEDGLNLYLGNHWETAKEDGWIRVTLNRIQNCIIAVMAVQAADPPRITFTPRESGEPPLVFINTNSAAGMALAAELGGHAAGSGAAFDPADPLPPDVAQGIQQDIAAGQLASRQAAAMGQPPPDDIVTSDAIVEVNDQSMSDALQTVFDGIWEAAGLQMVYAENVLNKNVLGFQPSLYEFDDQVTKLPIVENIHPVQVFLDPIKGHIRRCQYAIYDQPLGAMEAKALYPQFANEIEDAAATGPLRYPGARPYYPGYRFTQAFYRPMIVIRHCWIRNHPYPLSPDEALANGRLLMGQLATGGVVQSLDDNGQPVSRPETRSALLHPTTGKEVTQTLVDENGQTKNNPEWPIEYRIRQIKIVLDHVVEDRRCECPDIPLPCNVNIPVPMSPYGQGEPARLKGIQQAINRLVSSAVTNQAYTALPPEWIDKAIADRVGEASLRDMRTKPGQRIQIPHDLLLSVGADIRKLFGTIDPPQLPADFWKLLQLLLSLIDKEGNLADVLQGNASAGWSGDAIESLQNAASQILRAKSMMTEYWLKDLTKLILYDICYRLGPEDWAKWCRKYPPQALQALHRRSNPLETEISVSISSGSGAAKQSQTNTRMQARAAGVPISNQTILEEFGLDPDVEMQRNTEWSRDVAAQQQSSQMAGGAGMPPPAVGAGSPPAAVPAPIAAGADATPANAVVAAASAANSSGLMPSMQ